MPKMQVRGTQSFFGDVQDVRYADNAGTWYPELVGAASVLRRRIFGKILMAVGVFHRLRRVTERQ